MEGFNCTKYQCFTGVGSRETPDPMLQLMVRVATHLCNQGYRLRSGGAPGADDAFYRGVRKSPRFYEVGAEIFLPWQGFYDQYEDPVEGIWDASKFRDTEKQAMEIAMAARGGFAGLRRGGIACHSRNPYQVLGRKLNNPSGLVICYAEPTSNGQFKGGTNTAIQLALQRNIPVLNLATEEGYARVKAFLKKQEHNH